MKERQTVEGRVYKATGSWYTVRIDGTDTYIQARIKGKFRLEGFRLTNPVAVGDRVVVERVSEEEGVIKEILPRKNYVVRQSPRKKYHLHLIAANIDQAALIVTIRYPNLKPGFIDRYLLMTEPYEIPVLIVFNKRDLYDEEDLEVYQYLSEIYTDIGYSTMLISARTGEGVEEFKEALKGKITLLGGQSGVGKSTLINAIAPGLNLKTRELSRHTGKGQHTTTFAEMFDLDFGATIIDTPGIKNLSFNHLDPQHVTDNFREIFRYAQQCKFSNCTHRNEPACAVKKAVEEGKISELRYVNYLTILEEVESQKAWERLDDM